MSELTIKGTITRNGVTTEFQVDADDGWQQWGGDQRDLGKNVDLIDEINQAVWEAAATDAMTEGEND